MHRINLKNYERVELELIKLSESDVISTSDKGPWDTTVSISSAENMIITNDSGIAGGAE